MKYLTSLMFALVISLMFATSAHALEEFNDTPLPDPCGSIDPERPCYGAAATGCKQGYGYEACKTYCICMYNQNLKKCGTRLACKDVAVEEKNACLANCVADW